MSTEPKFTCPRCGMTSYHPTDIEQGYCGNCHQFTPQPITPRSENLAGLSIQMHAYLPPNTILVSQDIWESMRETYSEEGRDRAFLRALRIIPPGEPGKEEQQDGSV